MISQKLLHRRLAYRLMALIAAMIVTAAGVVYSADLAVAGVRTARWILGNTSAVSEPDYKRDSQEGLPPLRPEVMEEAIRDRKAQPTGNGK